MVRKLDRAAIVLIGLLVGLNAIIPGWGLMADGSVYGYRLPADWLTAAWPFDGYFIAGLVLLVVVGGGCLATAALAVAFPRAGAVAALFMGLVLVGWIGGELVFLTQTMFLTWVILGSGCALVALGAPYALPEIGSALRERSRFGMA